MANEGRKIDWRLFEFSLEELGMISGAEATAADNAVSGEDHNERVKQVVGGNHDAKCLC